MAKKPTPIKGTGLVCYTNPEKGRVALEDRLGIIRVRLDELPALIQFLQNLAPSKEG